MLIKVITKQARNAEVSRQRSNKKNHKNINSKQQKNSYKMAKTLIFTKNKQFLDQNGAKMDQKFICQNFFSFFHEKWIQNHQITQNENFSQI